MKTSMRLVRAAIATTLICGACGPAPEAADGEQLSDTSRGGVTFEEFLGTVHQDPSGLYIYDGDLPARDLAELRQAWERMYPQNGALTVGQLNAATDAVWSAAKKNTLTYCVSDNLKANKQAVINAMAAAGSAWSAQVDVNFIYVPAHDANCTNLNESVVFNVVRVETASAPVTAFFPPYEREHRTLSIHDSAYNHAGWPSLAAVLMHELGHTLGFRHEFLQSGMCYANTEPGGWRAVTPYDAASIMNYPYPECGGTVSSGPTQSDIEGAAQLYGSRVHASASLPAGCGLIPGGKGLDRGQYLYSCDGRFFLHFSAFGELRLVKITYTSSGSVQQLLWSSGTAGKAGYGAYMQADGNLVIYTGLGRPIWHTNTYGQPGSTLSLQNDGNLVIYSPQGQFLWHTNTWGN